jgi:hypothetical protein
VWNQGRPPRARAIRPVKNAAHRICRFFSFSFFITLSEIIGRQMERKREKAIGKSEGIDFSARR